MSSFFFTAFVLVWPFMAAMVMLVLCVGLFRDIREARRTGEAMV
ncbi:putative transporter small subunit [Comamonas suwonensis]|nr:putative transporter small subunit [Comamonas suwonensis]